MNSRRDIIDQALVLRVQEGSARAFRQLVARWHGPLVGYAVHVTGDRDLAGDVVQEAWVSIVRGIGGLDDPAAFRAWAHRIVTRRAADAVRGIVRRRALHLGAPAREVEAGDDVSARVRGALAALALEKRAILVMRYFTGMSVGEIAIAMEVPAGTVKSRLHHARKELEDVLKGEPDG